MTTTTWLWIGFNLFVLAMLAIDLGVFHRKSHTVGFKEALGWTAVWFTLAMLFAWGLRPLRGEKEAGRFLHGVQRFRQPIGGPAEAGQVRLP